MSTCGVSIVPIGKGASVSAVLSRCLKVLGRYPDLKWKLTPMSTQIEGPTARIFEAIQAMHQQPFEEGVPRVYTVIALDERRDKELTLDGKVAAVESKLTSG